MCKNAHRRIPITLHKIQLEMDQSPQHKVRHTQLLEETVENGFARFGTEKLLSKQNTKINN